jgi:glutamine synthetase
MLMAGLDGIKNRTHPGDAIDKNLYDLPPAELAEIPTVCGSLDEAMDSLKADHAFLCEGGVFTNDQIDAYIELKQEEIDRFRMMPHPIEFDMYYSV